MYLPRIVLIALCILTFVILAAVCLLSWKKKQLPLGQGVFLLALCAGIYAFSYAGELASSQLSAIKFWLHLENIGISFLPIAWVVLAQHHTQVTFRYDKLLLAILLMLCSITLILSQTTEIHHLYYQSVTLNPDAPFPVAWIVPGLWYHIHTILNNAALLLGNIFYILYWRKSSYPTNQQPIIFLLGSLFPWVSTILYSCGYMPWGLDPSPISFMVPGILYGWAIYHLNLFEVAPLAQKVIFQALSDAILIFDTQGVLADFNNASKKLFPELTAASLGQEASVLFASIPDIRALLSQKQKQPIELQLPAPGNNRYQAKKIDIMHNQKKAGFILTFHDITFFSNQLDSLQIKASTDPLTGIANRNKLDEDIQSLIESIACQPMHSALLLIDIDHFKQINDTFGHIAGDTILKLFSAVSEKNLRQDDILGRYGGDEFIIILPHSEQKDALLIAERIRSSIANQEIPINESHIIQITISIGIAMADTQNSCTDMLSWIKSADQALYMAKESGRNQVRLYERPNRA